MSGKQSPPPRAPRSGSSIVPRPVADSMGREAYLLSNKKAQPAKTNAAIAKVEPAAETPAPEAPAPFVESFRHSLAMPIIEGERINYKAIVLMVIAALFTFELLRRHRRRKALRRTYTLADST